MNESIAAWKRRAAKWGFDEFGYSRGPSLERQACSDPSSWSVDPSVCENCGVALDKHKDKIPTAYRSALWSWALKKGGIPSYYGDGYEVDKTIEILEHLEGCSINYDKSREPAPGSWPQFGGTFTNSENEISGVTAEITCVCGDVFMERWAIMGGLTLGEMIYQVVHEEDR